MNKELKLINEEEEEDRDKRKFSIGRGKIEDYL